MAESKELQALDTITSEVDSSHLKIILSSQCIKAQIFLVDRLRKQSQRQKDNCKHISSGNLKLEAEIKHAQLELKSMMTAQETLKSANIDIKKELLLAKERKLETTKRVEDGEKRYEDLWTQCKKRYESIPFVQKWFTANNKTQDLKDEIERLNEEAIRVEQELVSKYRVVKELNKSRIIEIAKFMTQDRPKTIQAINEKVQLAGKMSAEIEKLRGKQIVLESNRVTLLEKSGKSGNSLVLIEGDWPSLRENFNNDDRETLMMPRLHFAKNDLESLSANLEQMKKVVTTPLKMKQSKTLQDAVRSKPEQKKEDSYISTFFNKSYLTGATNNETENIVETEPKSFKKKKLINILEDIKIDKQVTKDIVSSIDVSILKPVNIMEENLGGKSTDDRSENNECNNEPQETHAMEEDPIEEIQNMNDGDRDVLIPPTPFMDITKTQTSTPVIVEVVNKENSFNPKQRRVAFDLPAIQEVPEDMPAPEEVNDGEITENPEIIDVTNNSQQLNLSTVSNESYSKMREMIFKKHNLDLSPEFTYTRNRMTIEEKVVTSKFFNNGTHITSVEKVVIPQKEGSPKDEQNKNVKNDKDIGMETDCNTQEQIEKLKKNYKEQVHEITVEEANIQKVIPFSKENSVPQKSDKTVSGLLFTHGPDGIPESLDISINTTGFEDGDGDFPHCIDASLLLSPKADLSMPVTGEQTGAFSQEVPNFLSGLRKTGFSFFGGSAAATSKPDSSGGNQTNNFNFNFNGDEKKSRGGLFSMFN